MRNIITTAAFCLVFAFGAFAQNYSTVQITPVNGVLTVNGIAQITIPNYDPSEVQLEPMSGSMCGTRAILLRSGHPTWSRWIPIPGKA